MKNELFSFKAQDKKLTKFDLLQEAVDKRNSLRYIKFILSDLLAAKFTAPGIQTELNFDQQVHKFGLRINNEI